MKTTATCPARGHLFTVTRAAFPSRFSPLEGHPRDLPFFPQSGRRWQSPCSCPALPPSAGAPARGLTQCPGTCACLRVTRALVKLQTRGPTSPRLGFVEPSSSPLVCISSRLPGGADAAGPVPNPEELQPGPKARPLGLQSGGRAGLLLACLSKCLVINNKPAHTGPVAQQVAVSPLPSRPL